MASPDHDDRDDARPTLLERLSALLTREPEDRGELLDLLRGAFERLDDQRVWCELTQVGSLSDTTPVTLPESATFWT